MDNPPVEVVNISPEALTVANTYLQNQDLDATAEILNLPTEKVNEFLNRREVKSYIDNVFLDIGFNNRFKMRRLMDKLIEMKLLEMQETGRGSNLDIGKLIELSHKMTMDHKDRDIKATNNIKTQTNIQINDPATNYTALINNLMNNNAKDI